MITLYTIAAGCAVIAFVAMAESDRPLVVLFWVAVLATLGLSLAVIGGAI